MIIFCLVFAFSITIVSLSARYLKTKEEKCLLEEKNNDLQRELIFQKTKANHNELIYQSEIADIRVQISQMNIQIAGKDYELNLLRNIKSVDSGTLEAVRYAMIHSHPDNGGDSEQFIKFKEVYDSLSKKL